MLDETLLDAPDDLALADRRGLLRGAAEAGARVRTAARHAAEAGIADLHPEGRPRAVLVAGPGTASAAVADLIGALAGASAPVVRLQPTGVAPAAGALRWALPGWAGSVDLLLLPTTDGSEPGLALLAEQAYRRGITVVAVAPEGSPLTETVSGSRGLFVPMAVAPNEAPNEYAENIAASPGTLWALFTPLLMLLDRVGLLEAPPEALEKVADRLDRTAERCGPAIATYSNPAKTLAAELADTLPLIWTEGAECLRLLHPVAEEVLGVRARRVVAGEEDTVGGSLTPLLMLLDRVGLLEAPPEALEKVADRLDRTAERCGPAIATYSNPAKTLAAELADTLPLIWTEGAAAGPAGRRFAAVLAELAGLPALAAELPEALPAHGVLLAGDYAAGADPEDFFRDRVEEPQALRARVVLLRDRPADAPSVQISGRVSASSAASVLAGLLYVAMAGPQRSAVRSSRSATFSSASGGASRRPTRSSSMSSGVNRAHRVPGLAAMFSAYSFGASFGATA
ncbi:SIS domain-containing protein, partial [Streptomyces sp. adm13(2018)]|uniref:SIS domain-containing protein n=1 Tax=Streptomyces sp. adm13(2018) TaxID=2479007 RepID=UPI0021C9B1BF